jgi:hypothetical protein
MVLFKLGYVSQPAYQSPQLIELQRFSHFLVKSAGQVSELEVCFALVAVDGEPFDEFIVCKDLEAVFECTWRQYERLVP